MLDVTEIFTSLQGEGPLMGQPAIFLRLAGCLPPYCSWCDSSHALKPGRQMHPHEIEHVILKHSEKLVVITGGEPFLQWENGLAQLTDALTRCGRRVQFETSGKAGIPKDTGALVVCSPKPMDAPRLEHQLTPRVDAFKFVVGDDIGPALSFARIHAISHRKIWLMPLGSRRNEQLHLMPAVWGHCVKHGFNFSPRLHILAYDDKQGV